MDKVVADEPRVGVVDEGLVAPVVEADCRGEDQAVADQGARAADGETDCLDGTAATCTVDGIIGGRGCS